MIHIIQTTFTGKGFKKIRLEEDDEWIKKRIDIFKKYSLPSLLNQTNKKFLHWISWRPEEKNKPFIKDLKAYLNLLNYNFIFTYYGWGSFNVLSTDEHKRTVEERLRKSLWEVRKLCPGNDDIYYTATFASDDLYSNNAIKEIQEMKLEKKEMVYFGQGYIYSIEKDLVARWNPGSLSPFYTIFFEADTFWNAGKHLNYFLPVPTYEEVFKFFRSKRIPGRKYVVLYHGLNHNIEWNCGFARNIFSREETSEVLKDFTLKRETRHA